MSSSIQRMKWNCNTTKNLRLYVTKTTFKKLLEVEIYLLSIYLKIIIIEAVQKGNI